MYLCGIVEVLGWVDMESVCLLDKAEDWCDEIDERDEGVVRVIREVERRMIGSRTH
jgi:hypothetical protein